MLPGCKSGVRVEDGAVGEGVVSSIKEKDLLTISCNL